MLENNDKFRCECKDLIDKGICEKEFIWNRSNCECECDKSCYVKEHLDYENCKCRKRLVDKLVEECSENIDENEITNATLNEYKDVCRSYAVYIVLFAVFLITNISIISAFIYFRWYLKKNVTDVVNINPVTETTVY